MRTSTAYFAGVATVVVAIAVGLAGGLAIADIMSPTPARPEMTRLEQRSLPRPLPASIQPHELQAQQAPVPYVAASQAAAVTAAHPQNQTQTRTQANAQAGTPASQTASPLPQPAPREQADKRKSDRQQQWAGRRKNDQQREQELRDAQARMADDDGPRDVVIRRDWREDRADYDQPARFGFPRFNLFGPN
jgi:hypothetical protein